MVNQIKFYKVDIDIEGIDDDDKNMFSTTYETKIRPTPIRSELVKDIKEDLDVIMEKIYRRTNKWVEWMVTQKNKTRATSPQSTPNLEPKNTPSATTTSTLPPTKGPSQFVGQVDQPPKKDATIEKTCQGKLVQVTKAKVEVKKKKFKDPHDTQVLVEVQTWSIPTPPLVVHLTPPSSFMAQIVDVDDNDSRKEEEPIDSHDETKKSSEEIKKSEAMKLITPR